jgi:hypothetical protein
MIFWLLDDILVLAMSCMGHTQEVAVVLEQCTELGSARNGGATGGVHRHDNGRSDSGRSWCRV